MLVDSAKDHPIGEENRAQPHAEGRNATAHRLVNAGIALIAQGGLRALTVRDVAAMADISFPSVQYHFPAKADLMDAVFAEIADSHAGITESIQLGDSQSPLGDMALVGIVQAVLTGWCTTHAALTMTAHELLLAAYRDESRSAPAALWIQRQHDAWNAVLVRLLGKTDDALAWLIIELMIGLSVMTLGCGRPVEASLANEEILRFALLNRTTGVNPIWYGSFVDAIPEDNPAEDADSTMPDIASHPAARRILGAGLKIVAEEGSSAVTFRGVAQRGEVALSSVTNNFHTRENLLYRIYRWIHDEMTNMSVNTLPTAPGAAAQSEFERYSGHFRKISSGDMPYFLASYDLILAAARDERLAARAWRMRMTRGIYFLIRRGKMSAPPIALQFRWHIVSLWSIGVGVVHHIRATSPESRAAAIDTRLKAGLEHLSR